MPVGETTDTRKFNGDDDFWPTINADLATIHKLLHCEDYSTPDPGICPGCSMPFDKGKKRKLIDACGHERCYSCMFRNEACPLCTANDSVKAPKKSNGCSELRMVQESPDSHYAEVKKFSTKSTGTVMAGVQGRPKMKTNGHFTPLMKSRGVQDERCWRDVSPSRLPRPAKNDVYSSISSSTHNLMTKSCPTPPNRRRFFSSKGLKGSVWSFKGLTQSSSNSNNTVSDEMTASAPAAEDARPWSSVVFSKIKSLWSYSSSSLMAGLNAITTGKRESSMLLLCIFLP